jgi:hypothetical protein
VVIGTKIAAKAEPPVAKRRPDGIYYQETGRAGAGRRLIIEARGLLAQANGRALKPITGWKIDGTISHFPTGILPVTARWPFDRRPTTMGANGQRRIVDDPLDVLPHHLAAPVGGAEVSAWQNYRRDWAEEPVVSASLCQTGSGSSKPGARPARGRS